MKAVIISTAVASTSGIMDSKLLVTLSAASCDAESAPGTRLLYISSSRPNPDKSISYSSKGKKPSSAKSPINDLSSCGLSCVLTLSRISPGLNPSIPVLNPSTPPRPISLISCSKSNAPKSIPLKSNISLNADLISFDDPLAVSAVTPIFLLSLSRASVFTSPLRLDLILSIDELKSAPDFLTDSAFLAIAVPPSLPTLAIA